MKLSDLQRMEIYRDSLLLHEDVYGDGTMAQARAYQHEDRFFIVENRNEKYRECDQYLNPISDWIDISI